MTDTVQHHHCAKFTDSLLPVARHLLTCVAQLPGGAKILDPFAGIGKGVRYLSECGFAAEGRELEPEWASADPLVKRGNALSLPYIDGIFDAIFTSPTYGNRMADVDMRESVAGTYAKSLGRRASEGSSCHLQWGPVYREFHELAWTESKRVLKLGGWFLLNIKDHPRDFELQGVPQWHFDTLRALGFVEVKREFIATPGNKRGANKETAVNGEFLWLGQLCGAKPRPRPADKTSMTQALLKDAPGLDIIEDPPDTGDDIEIIDPTRDRDVKTALVVGDMHGNLFSWGRTIVPAIRRHRPDVVIQVGDFGFGWDQYYLEALDEILDDCAGPDVIWLDGNHENFDWLEAMAAFGAPSAFATSRRTWYLPRGYTWEWQGRRCMSVGGAYSVDKAYRTPHQSWWPQEELTDADVARAQSAGHVDVLFAHDAFAGFKVPGPHAAFQQAGEFDRLAMPNRLKLLDIVKVAKPSLYFAGHYHHGYALDARAGGHEVHVVGLNREDEIGSTAMLEFPSLTVTGL